MPDEIAAAPTARSKCRGCGRTIDKGALRFGEAEANPFGEGETQRWFHLECAALKRPERFGPALDAATDVPECDTLRALVTSGLEHPRLVRIVRAERAPSARAHCRHCRELIDKGALRIALEIWEDGRFSPMGSVHASCAPSYFETRELMPRLERTSPELSTEELARLRETIASAPDVPYVPREEASGEETKPNDA